MNLVPYDGTPAHLVQTFTDFDDMFKIDVPPGTQKLLPGRLVNRGAVPMQIVQLQGYMHKRGVRRDASGAPTDLMFATDDEMCTLTAIYYVG